MLTAEACRSAQRHLCSLVALGALALTQSRCTPPELCVPRESSFDFFSKGDCILTNAVFFQGHEWITYFGNRDLSTTDRFSAEDLHHIAEGNRRVDWPKELLVYLNTSPVHYYKKLTEHTNRPENQRLHFLLDDRNTSVEAAAQGVEAIRVESELAVELWNVDRVAALTKVGRAQHTLQDSFSAAHTVRAPERDWCLVKVKAYIPRAPGHDDPDLEFHGGDRNDEVGHTTVEDSIYRAGRDCHDPVGASQVEACLNDSALRAGKASRDHLELIRQAVTERAAAGNDDAPSISDTLFDQFAAKHLAFCE